MVGSSPAWSVHVPTGLKLILRCRESGLASRLHGSCSSIEVTRWESDIVVVVRFYSLSLLIKHRVASLLCFSQCLPVTRSANRSFFFRSWHGTRSREFVSDYVGMTFAAPPPVPLSPETLTVESKNKNKSGQPQQVSGPKTLSIGSDKDGRRKKQISSNTQSSPKVRRRIRVLYTQATQTECRKRGMRSDMQPAVRALSLSWALCRA